MTHQIFFERGAFFRGLSRHGGINVTLIATPTHLAKAWSSIFGALMRDPLLGGRFVHDPVAALSELGYSIGPAALEALEAARP